MPLTPNLNTRRVLSGEGTVRKRAHDRLDAILDEIQAGGFGGGESIIVDTDNRILYRLTFCDFTAESKCLFCNGTGVSQL